ncbi:hypothetical protein JKP88DRAFT_279198 [Tribonema minus]|uniref:Uncharacterized protein n=1 Tax=Tribonema minus TaxID=303371 RepID=A0A835YTL4_9STRA|nr:hypothetical protein JKP88DRAFT_279198 [Tribonema minus]
MKLRPGSHGSSEHCDCPLGPAEGLAESTDAVHSVRTEYRRRSAADAAAAMSWRRGARAHRTASALRSSGYELVATESAPFALGRWKNGISGRRGWRAPVRRGPRSDSAPDSPYLSPSLLPRTEGEANTFSTAEMASLLFKKIIAGKPSTTLTNQDFQEPTRPARPAVMQSQIWAETVPAVAPADLASVTTDDLGAALAGSAAGRTSSVSPMVRKYEKVQLEPIAGSGGASFEAPDVATYGRVLQDAIPYGYDPAGSYLYTLYKSDGVTPIPFGGGNFVIDTESGTCTFYALGNITGVDATHPPRISFYRYVGQKGAATASQTAAAIEAQSLTFQEPITFQGGDSGVTTDALAAIVLDDRNLASLALDTPAMALQLGADADGSWRVCSFGGGGSATATSLAIQVRVAGAWVTKASYSPE